MPSDLQMTLWPLSPRSRRQNNPLIVINGVPVDNSNYALGGNFGNRAANSSDGGDGLSSINPDDIESMTVLKGATAAALYGSH